MDRIPKYIPFLIAAACLVGGVPSAAQTDLPPVERQEKPAAERVALVWSGVIRQPDGTLETRPAVREDLRPAHSAYQADPTARELLDRLARVQVELDIDRDRDKARKDLALLWVEAAWKVNYPRRADVLVQVVLTISDLARREGALEVAREALESLWPGHDVAALAPRHVFEHAGEAELAFEREALQDPRLVAARARLSLEAKNAPAAAVQGDAIDEAVASALEYQQLAVIHDIGARAASALARRVLADLDAYPAQHLPDELVLLVQVSELSGARLMLDHFDEGGFFWKKRMVRAMKDGRVLSNEGTWQRRKEDGDPPLLLEPIWLEVLTRLLADPLVRRDAVTLLRWPVLYDALDPSLQAEIIAALNAGDRDLLREVLGVLDVRGARATLEPILGGLVHHEDAALREFGAERLAAYARSPALLSAVDHPDAAVRLQVAIALRSRRVPIPDYSRYPLCTPDEVAAPNSDSHPVFGATERAVLEKLLIDRDDEVRLRATWALVHDSLPGIRPELYAALARDPDKRIRLTMTHVELESDARRAALLTELASDVEDDVAGDVMDRIVKVFTDGGGASPARASFYVPAVERLAFRPESPLVAPGALEGNTRRILRGVGQAPQGLNLLIEWGTKVETPQFAAEIVDVVADLLKDASRPGRDIELSPEAPLGELYVRAAAVAPRQLADLEKGMGSSRSRCAPHLIALVGRADLDRRVRWGAAMLSLEAGGEELERGLLGLLRDPSWTSRSMDRGETSLLSSWARKTPEPRASRLALQIASDRSIDDDVALRYLGRVIEEVDDSERIARACLERWFGSPHAEFVVRRSLERLVSADEQAASWLERAVRDPETVYTAVETMGRMRAERFLPVLGQCLRADWIQDPGDRAEIQMAAARGLASYLNDEAAELLLQGVGWTDEPTVRDACFAALDAIRRYQDERLRWDERRSGAAARESAVRRLAEMLDDADPTVRAQAVRSLGTLRAVEFLPDLVGLLKDPDGDVRDAARDALEVINGARDD